MPRCVAGFCDNTAASGHGMFTFPKDPGLNKKWRVNMKRAKSPREPHKLWENTEYSRLCGAHFQDDCFLVSHSLSSSIEYMPGRLQLKSESQRSPNKIQGPKSTRHTEEWQWAISV